MLQYLIKFSISVAVLYVFYRAVLRPLTFYKCNRFYLLCYSLLSFVIPFINITPWVAKETAQDNQLISIIPAIGNYTPTADKTVSSSFAFIQHFTLNQWLLLLFSIGTAVMFIRIMCQYLSLGRIRSKSVLLNSSDNVHLYQTSAEISPFSFGNAIYFNSNLHTEEELQRIIQHEFVHVKQKHSIDILVGELLCVVNWFNPFAWAIRYAIRQNLEFIADNDVLANGLDKKEYQYLLLKVIGVPQYSIANNFNFSNLKKRIAMMNKMKTAKLHLTKFLFVLPLLTVLLLAFRNKINEDEKTFVFTGIIYNTEEPLQTLSGVAINEKYSGQSVLTDANGYFKMKIPLKNDSILRLNYDYVLNGVDKSAEMSLNMNLAGMQNSSVLIFTGINKWEKDAHKNIMVNAERNLWSGSSCYRFDVDPDYTFVQDKFDEFRHQLKIVDSIAAKANDSKKPFWFVNGIPYALFADGIEGNSVFFDKYEMRASSEFAVWVDGQLMSIEEANAKVNRFELTAVGTCRAENAIKKFGVNKNIFIFYWKTKFGTSNLVNDTTPVPPPPPPVPAINAAPVKLAAPVINSKGYIVTIADNRGECVVIVKSKEQKIIKAIALTDWNKNKKENESQYGEIPPPPPPAPPIYSQLPPNVDGLSIADVSDKKKGIKEKIVTVTLGNGKKEVYNFNNPEQKAAYIKKYGELQETPPPPVISFSPGKVADAPQQIQPYAIMSGNFDIRNISTQKDLNNPLYIVDGKEMSIDQLNTINPNDIESISIFKDKNAIDKYGDKGKNNVIEIKLKQESQRGKPTQAQPSIVWASPQPNNSTPDSLLGALKVADSTGSVEVRIKKDGVNYTPKDVLVILDGKEMPLGLTIADLIKPANIASMEVMKDKAAVAVYGDKAKNGVIIIHSKSAKALSSPLHIKTDSAVFKAQPKVNISGNYKAKDNASFLEGDLSFVKDAEKQPLVIYNGEVVADPASFVLKKKKLRTVSIDSKQAIAKYGDKAKYGALEISSL